MLFKPARTIDEAFHQVGILSSPSDLSGSTWEVYWVVDEVSIARASAAAESAGYS